MHSGSRCAGWLDTHGSASQAAASEAASHAAGRLDELLVRTLAAAIEERPPGARPHRRAARDAMVDRAKLDRTPARRGAFGGSVGRGRSPRRPGRAEPGDGCGGAGTTVCRRRGARSRRAARGNAAPRRGGDGASSAGGSGRGGCGASRGTRIVPRRQPALLVDRSRRGPLTVYDLESLGEAPTLCVLSACDSGLSEVRAGDELMGLTATLLALGSASIVASVVAVRRDGHPAGDRRSIASSPQGSLPPKRWSGRSGGRRRSRGHGGTG